METETTLDDTKKQRTIALALFGAFALVGAGYLIYKHLIKPARVIKEYKINGRRKKPRKQYRMLRRKNKKLKLNSIAAQKQQQLSLIPQQ